MSARTWRGESGHSAGGFYIVAVIGSIYSFAIAAGTNGGHAVGLVAGTANVVSRSYSSNYSGW